MNNETIGELDKGLVYIVTGHRQYYRECLRSVQSLYGSGYQGSTLITAEDPNMLGQLRNSAKIRIEKIPLKGNSHELSRRMKTTMAQWTPFSDTLYLDTDTIIQRPIDAIWDILDGSSMGLSLDDIPTLGDVLKTCVLTGRYSLDEAAYTRKICSPISPQYNGGVFLFHKCCSTEEFFSIWEKEWLRFKHLDQLALMRAITITNVGVGLLDATYNSPKSVQVENKGKAVIFHYWDYRRPVKRGWRIIKESIRNKGYPVLKKVGLIKIVKKMLAYRPSAKKQTRIYEAVRAHELRDEIIK